MYISVLNLGELRKGIEKIDDSEKKNELNQRVKEDLSNRFKNRVLNISMKEVNKWGEVLATAEENGNPLPAIDSLIAATAQVHDLTVVTRHSKAMNISDYVLTYPWNYLSPDSMHKT